MGRDGTREGRVDRGMVAKGDMKWGIKTGKVPTGEE